jgi:hypothetical protein
MSCILVIGGALTPRQGYEQCEGRPLSWRSRNTFQMNDEISQNKLLNIFVYFFYILLLIYLCNSYSYIIDLFINIYIIK